MGEPAVITVAITGAIPTQEDNPAVPVTPAEQIESAHAAFEAGATVCHIHARDAGQRPSSDPDLFRQVQEGLASHCPEMIVQFSTGARGRPREERVRPLELGPDMASLATGSVNFPEQIYDNPAGPRGGVRPEDARAQDQARGRGVRPRDALHGC